MTCSHRNPETYFCSVKKRSVPPEQIDICENCPDYKLDVNLNQLFCNSCEKNFNLTQNRIVIIKGKEFAKCPDCGEVIGIGRDNQMLR